MEKIVRKFASHEEAEEADYEYYANLTPNERLQHLLEILSLVELDETETSQGMERFFRIAPLGES